MHRCELQADAAWADGKIQLNLFDPDLPRIEYMEFEPVDTPCYSPFMGKHPGEVEEQ